MKPFSALLCVLAFVSLALSSLEVFAQIKVEWPTLDIEFEGSQPSSFALQFHHHLKEELVEWWHSQEKTRSSGHWVVKVTETSAGNKKLFLRVSLKEESWSGTRPIEVLPAYKNYAGRDARVEAQKAFKKIAPRISGYKRERKTL